MVEAKFDVGGLSERLGLDDQAAQALAELPAEAQVIAVALVEQQDCRNPSAVMWTKIRALRKDPLRAKAEYLRQELDDAAYAALRTLPVPLQQAVISDIDVLKCRNLSAVVWSKMRSLSMVAGAPPLVMATGTKALGAHAAMEKAAAMNLDQGAQEALRRLTKGDQRDVMAQVTPEACRNPSAVVITKIQEVRRRMGVLGLSGILFGADAFAVHAGLDARALKALSELPAQQAYMVLALVAKENCKNLSAVAWSKVKKVRQNPDEVKMDFLRKFIDETALKALEQMPQPEQERIASEIDVLRCRNLSAVVIAKARGSERSAVPQPALGAGTQQQPTHEQTVAFGAGTQQQPAHERPVAFGSTGGQWQPPPAQPVAFNSTGAQRQPPLAQPVAPSEFSTGTQQWQPPPAQPAAGAGFGMQLDARATEALKQLGPDEQLRLLSELGGGQTVRNPSAFVWSRIKKMHEEQQPHLL